MESNKIHNFLKEESEVIGFLRDRQMTGTFVNERIEDKLPWEWAMNKNSARGVELLISLHANISNRTDENKGFLLHGLDTAMPRWLLIHGLRKLDRNWWLPDNAGQTPFHHPSLDRVVAQAIGHRAWSEGVSATMIKQISDPIELAYQRDQKDIARILKQWLK